MSHFKNSKSEIKINSSIKIDSSILILARVQSRLLVQILHKKIPFRIFKLFLDREIVLFFGNSMNYGAEPVFSLYVHNIFRGSMIHRLIRDLGTDTSLLINIIYI